MCPVKRDELKAEPVVACFASSNGVKVTGSVLSKTREIQNKVTIVRVFRLAKELKLKLRNERI